MRLSTISQLPEHLVTALEHCGIRTDTDLLFSRTPIEVFHALPNGMFSLHELLQYFDIVTETVSAPGTTALSVLAQAEHHPGIKTGLPVFDKLVGESNRHGIIEVSGPRFVGKSSLALNVVLHYLVAHSDATAIWFDTTGEFMPERVTPILESLGAHDATAILDRLQVCPCFDTDSVRDILDTETSSDDAEDVHRPRCQFVVIDTITRLLGPNLSAVSAQGHAMMVHFMRYLRDKTRVNQLTVLVVNSSTQVKSGNNPRDRQPALGPSFPFLTDSTLWLSVCNPSEDDGTCTLKIEVLRSRMMPPKTCRTFKLRNGVVCEDD